MPTYFNTKNILYLLLFYTGVLFLQSCESSPSCEMRQEYTIRVSSDVHDAYALFVDGEYVEDVAPLSFVDILVREGYHEIYLEQLEGYHTQPNTEVYDVQGLSCDYFEILFPD